MKTPLRLLLCEDMESDAMLVIRELEKNGWDVNWHRVETAADMRDALMREQWQIVVSDYNIPGFGGDKALEIFRQHRLDIPFLLVSGAIGEETAVNMMKAGVNDYLMKDRLSRLSETVKKELRDAELRMEYRESVEKLRASEARYRAFIDQSMMAILLARPGGNIEEANIAATELFGYTPDEFRQLNRDQLLDLTSDHAVTKLAERSEKGKVNSEFTGIRKNGERFYCEVSSVIFKGSDGNDVASAMISDITARKTAEEKLRETNRELKDLSRHLKNARETERRHMAREVHDQLGQLATALKIDVDWLVMKVTDTDSLTKLRIEHIETTIDTLITSIRQIASNLRPSVLDDFGLNVALEWQCREFETLNNIPTTFVASLDDTAITAEQKTELYRIAQESLTNVMRHAKAASVQVTLSADESSIELTVTDDGQGFDPLVARGGSLGLVGLRERVTALRGKLVIDTAEGKGTTIHVIIPKKQSICES